MKTFKALKTGRIYDVAQVLYYSKEVIEENAFGEVFRIVIADPSRHLMCLYEKASFIEGDDDIMKLHDGLNASHVFTDSADFKDLNKHFGLVKIDSAINEIINARYEMTRTHDLDRKSELSVEIGQAEVFINSQLGGQQ